MSIVSASQPSEAMTSAGKPPGITDQPLSTVCPRASCSLTWIAFKRISLFEPGHFLSIGPVTYHPQQRRRKLPDNLKQK